MEVVLFHRYGKKGASSQTKPLKDLSRILPPDNYLAEEKRVTLLQQIREACILESARFDSLCLTALHNLINHSQNLPETSNSYYSQQGGFLDHALNRTESALNLFSQYLLVDDKAEFSEEQKLWQYALFSAALLQGVGKLQIDFLVELYDNNGQFLKQWNPLLENLSMVGSHYSYSFQKEQDAVFRQRLNILLARTLMPSSGFSWIASNSQVLAVWLALLNEDYYAAGTLGAILIRADALAIQRYFSQFHIRAYGSRGGRYGRAATFTGGTPDVNGMEQQIGIEFIQWLTKLLAKGELVINREHLLMVPGGLLMSEEVFKWFVSGHPDYTSWQAVRNGFLSLGLHRLAADGGLITRFEQNNNQQMHSGIVFANYAVALPPEVQLHNLSTGKTAPVTATDLIYMSKFNNYFTRQQATPAESAMLGLNSSGQWQAIVTPPAPGISRIPGALTGA